MIKRYLVYFMAAALFIAPQAISNNSSGVQTETRTVVSLNPYYGGLRTIDVQIGDRVARLLLDTGGGLTMISPELAEAVGCGPHGALIGFRMSGERVTSQKCGAINIHIGTYHRQIEPGVFDLMELLPSELPHVDGVISLDLFDGEIVTLDLAGESLTIADEIPTDEHTAEGEMRVMREMGGIGLTVFVRATAQTGHLNLLLDSANLDTMILSPSALEQLDIPIPAEASVFAVSTQLVGLPAVSIDARVRDIIYDGALNYSTMLQYRITMDLAQERIWYNPVPNQP